VLNPMAIAMGCDLSEQSTPAPQAGDAPDRWLRALYAQCRARRSDDGRPQVRRRLKTLQSQRDAPLLWIVLEGGFLDFVAVPQARRAPGCAQI